MKRLSRVFVVACFLAVVVPVLAFVSVLQGEGLSQFVPTGSPLMIPYLLYAGSLILVIPWGLVKGVQDSFEIVRPTTGRGLVAGGVLALWSNALAVGMPFAGFYPTLPAMLAARAVAPGPEWTIGFWIVLLVGNVLVWMTMGVLFSRTWSWLV